MTNYLRRNAWMGMIAMLALVALALVRHAPPSLYAALTIVGVLQALIVRALDRKLRTHRP